MGFSTTFSILAFLFIFAGMSVVVIGMQQSITAAATAIQTQQQELLQAQQQDLEITTTNYQYGQETTWSTTYNDEFNQGSYNNTTATSDQVELDTQLTGTYTSNAYNTGFASNYTTISFSAVIPADSNLTFQIRSANTTSALESTNFVGPDGTTTTTYDTSGQAISSTHNQDQIIQYQATFQATTTTPELQEVQIGVQREVGHVTLELTNIGDVALKPEQTDVYSNGVRIQRTSQQRELDVETTQSQRLWESQETLNITVFETISATQPYTVVNGYARDQTTVSP